MLPFALSLLLLAAACGAGTPVEPAPPPPGPARIPPPLPPDPTPTFPPAPAEPATHFQDGTHFHEVSWRVNVDIEPGRYFTSPPDGRYAWEHCEWGRVAEFSSPYWDVITYESAPEGALQAIADIAESDHAFLSKWCGNWNRSPEPTPPAGTIPAGVWLVGDQVWPGVYAADDAEDGCYWERRSGFDGTLDTVLQNDIALEDGRQVVEIEPGDAGFSSHEACGIWRLTTTP